MVAMNAVPPYPAAAGADWSDLWQLRLEKAEPYLLKWLAHPTEDEYWRRGSIVGEYDKIQAASLLIGGWYDGYLSPPLRTFEELRCPKKLLMGPWQHSCESSPIWLRCLADPELVIRWQRQPRRAADGHLPRDAALVGLLVE